MAAPGPAAARLRRYVYTGAFAAITIAGTIYGAGLKTQQEVKVVCAFSLYCLSLSP